MHRKQLLDNLQGNISYIAEINDLLEELQSRDLTLDSEVAIPKPIASINDQHFSKIFKRAPLSPNGESDYCESIAVFLASAFTSKFLYDTHESKIQDMMRICNATAAELNEKSNHLKTLWGKTSAYDTLRSPFYIPVFTVFELAAERMLREKRKRSTSNRTEEFQELLSFLANSDQSSDEISCFSSDYKHYDGDHADRCVSAYELFTESFVELMCKNSVSINYATSIVESMSAIARKHKKALQNASVKKTTAIFAPSKTKAKNINLAPIALPDSNNAALQPDLIRFTAMDCQSSNVIDIAKTLEASRSDMLDQLCLKYNYEDIAIGLLWSILYQKDEVHELNCFLSVIDCLEYDACMNLSQSNATRGYRNAHEADRRCTQLYDPNEVFIYQAREDIPPYAHNLGQMLSADAGVRLDHTIPLLRDCTDRYHAFGFSERKSRDLAIVTATAISVTLPILNDAEKHQWFYDQGTGETASPPAETMDEHICVLQKQIKQAKAEKREAQRESQSCRHEIADLKRKVEQLQQELANSNELLELHEQFEASSERDFVEINTDEEFQFPLKTDLSIVLYGGFPVFHQELSKLIPGMKIIPCATHIDTTPIVNADILFMQLNKTNHSKYWTVRDTAKLHNTVVHHLGHSGAKQCAIEMAKEIQKLQNDRRARKCC